MKREFILALMVTSLFLFFSSCTSNESLPDKGLSVLSPKANDIIKKGASHEIQWKTEVADSEFGAVVTIEFSKDGGKSWNKVEENLPKGKAYAWKVPETDSQECKIRVISQYRPEYRGTSGVFAVK